MWNRLRESLHRVIETKRVERAVDRDDTVCHDCGHPRSAHPEPVGACAECVKKGDDFIVCGKFVTEHTEGFVR